jgi:hypothetical protein
MDWSVTATQSLAANPPSKAVIDHFMNGLLSPASSDICGAPHFANLRHSGVLSLVVGEAERTFCYTEIVDKTSPGFEITTLSNAGPAKVKDLSGDGNLEIVADSYFTPFLGGAGPVVAAWPVIWAWTGKGYTDVSSRYKSYYEQKLASLKEQIAAAESGAPSARARATPAATSLSAPDTPPAPEAATAPISGVTTFRISAGPERRFYPPPSLVTPQPREPMGLKAEAAKIERFLGIDRDAGMGDAIRWGGER